MRGVLARTAGAEFGRSMECPPFYAKEELVFSTGRMKGS